MVFNMAATILYVTAFIACSAAVELTALKGSRPYNQRAAASVSTVPWGIRGQIAKPGLCPWAASLSWSEASVYPILNICT